MPKLFLPVGSQWPVTQPYGYDPTYPANSGYHFGIDYGVPIGSLVMAAARGIVVIAGPNQPQGFPGIGNGNWGNYIEIQHSDGLRTGYAHLSEVYAALGQAVIQGAVIGKSGDTGLTFGAHLHFQLLDRNGITRIDPAPSLAMEEPAMPISVGGKFKTVYEKLKDLLGAPRAEAVKSGFCWHQDFTGGRLEQGPDGLVNVLGLVVP